MPRQYIIYQHSSQFLPKITIKLENMLASIYEGKNVTHPIIHHYALKNIVKILKIIEKPELKSRLTKEFLRLDYVLPQGFKDEHAQLYQKFEEKSKELQLQSSRFGSQLHLDPFLLSLRMRSQDQWNECELQPPFLYNWLHQRPQYRQEMLSHWLGELRELKSIISIYSNLLHQLAIYETVQIQHSFFQKTMSALPTCQLVIMKLDVDLPIIPKIQMSTNALTIHFNDIDNHDKVPSLGFDMELGLVKI